MYMSAETMINSASFVVSLRIFKRLQLILTVLFISLYAYFFTNGSMDGNLDLMNGY